MEEAFCAISQTMAGLGADHKQLDLLIVARPTHLYISTAASHFPNKARSRQLLIFSLSPVIQLPVSVPSTSHPFHLLAHIGLS
jgi:hypothetical protein